MAISTAAVFRSLTRGPAGGCVALTSRQASSPRPWATADWMRNILLFESQCCGGSAPALIRASTRSASPAWPAESQARAARGRNSSLVAAGGVCLRAVRPRAAAPVASPLRSSAASRSRVRVAAPRGGAFQARQYGHRERAARPCDSQSFSGHDVSDPPSGIHPRVRTQWIPSGSEFGTPRGNINTHRQYWRFVSPRARDELAAAELVAARDTRRTGQLLTTLGLSRPLVSLHEHNETKRIAIVRRRRSRVLRWSGDTS